MFFAHGFGGYLVTRHLVKRADEKTHSASLFSRYILWGIFCSILPDLDLLYFYSLDNRQHLHHSYWTHMPVFWIFLACAIYSIGHGFFKKSIGLYCLILLAGTILHLLLDTVAGGIHWLYPWSDYKFQWFVIQPEYKWWVFNYIFHWTMLMEVTLMLLAYVVYRRDQRYSHQIQEQTQQVSPT